MAVEQELHTFSYDGKIDELYKIYALSITLSILTLGIYHFWGKTRKRRYITSSFILDNDRFEYTGYAKELIWGLVFGCLLLFSSLIPLIWAQDEIEAFNKQKHDHQQVQQEDENVDENETAYHFEQHDPFNHNKIMGQYSSLSNFWVRFNDQGVFLKYKNELLDVKWRLSISLFNSTLDAQFNPKKNIKLFIAVLMTPIYLIFFFAFLPFIIVFGSLRYRISRLRWRGIRGHLGGSALVYGSLGLINTILKVITVGFWIPISDIMLSKYKLKKLYFGNQKAAFNISYKALIMVNLGTIGAICYLVGLVSLVAYFILPYIASLAPHEGWLIEKLIFTLIKEGYYLVVILLIWICYIPRYWYRAALFRGRYNNLRFGNIGFTCDASGYDYFKLFVINDLIFILTLSLGLPILWQRRMQFFCKHVKVSGNLSELSILQAPGEKSKFGGGFASIMNLEIGLI
ncbi:MAG: DUF898 family protein [Proteobacteria bacterium]|nr:DUF898 family protein [Pseudomonadota bacterium]